MACGGSTHEVWVPMSCLYSEPLVMSLDRMRKGRHQHDLACIKSRTAMLMLEDYLCKMSVVEPYC